MWIVLNDVVHGSFSHTWVELCEVLGTVRRLPVPRDVAEVVAEDYFDFHDVRVRVHSVYRIRMSIYGVFDVKPVMYPTCLLTLTLTLRHRGRSATADVPDPLLSEKV